MRPQQETDLTFGDRTPSLFLADLLNLYTSVFPSLLEKKQKDADRVMPVRKRTVLVDQRISRSRLSAEPDPQALLEQQRALQNPPRATSPPPMSASNSSTGRAAPISASNSSSSRAAPALGSAFGLGHPVRRAPNPIAEDLVNVVPPTPEVPQPAQEGILPDPPAVADADEREEILSPTANVLESMIQEASEDAAVGAGPAGVKRAVSGEVSRLRGPRGEHFSLRREENSLLIISKGHEDPVLLQHESCLPLRHHCHPLRQSRDPTLRRRAMA